MASSTKFDSKIPYTQVNNIATETTLKEVKKAIENINLNVGEIVVGDISVQSDDTTTHDKLDTINATINSKTFNKLTSSIDVSGQRVDISGQTMRVSNLTDISGLRIDISGELVDISGQRVDISGQRVLVDISGQKVLVDVSGQRLDISGQRIDISGQKVDISGQRVVTDISGQRVDISGQIVIVDISGQRVIVDISGQRVDISGQQVIVDISGQTVLTDISGQRVDISGQHILVDISGQRIDISGQKVIVDISGSRVDRSGQTVLVDISGQTVLIKGGIDISGQTVRVSNINDVSGSRVDISGQRVLVDISGQRVDISGQTLRVSNLADISGSRVDISGQRVVSDISGQRVDISGQSMRVSNLSDISGIRVDISGQRVVSDISGQRVDISGQSVRVTSMPAISVTSDISGQTVRSNMYVSNNGTNWLYAKSDTNGVLNVNSMLQDGAGTDITSSLISGKQGLDTNIINVPTVQMKDSQGYNLHAVGQYVPQLKTSIYDPNGNIGATVQPAGATYAGYLNTFDPILNSSYLSSATGVMTVPKLFITGSSPNAYTAARCNANGDQYVSLSTNANGNTVRIDNTANTVKIDPANNLITIAGSQNVGITSTANKIRITDADNENLTLNPSQYDAAIIGMDTNAYMRGYSRTDTGYNTVTMVKPYTPNSSANTVRAMETYSYNVCLNNSANLYLPVTSTTTETTQSQDVYINNETTTNEYGRSGLNIYQIYPKKLQYFLYGQNASNILYALMGGYSCGYNVGSVPPFGLGNPKQYSVIAITGSAVPRTLKYHYVDASGNLQTNGSVVMSATNTPYSLGTNIISINKHWQDGSLGINDSYHIRIGIANTAANTIAGADFDDYYNGILTVPNGYIGYLTNWNVWTPGVSWMSTVKWEADGNRYISWTSYNTSNQPHQSGHNGSLGGIYYPGESIGIIRSTQQAGGVAGGMFVLEPI